MKKKLNELKAGRAAIIKEIQVNAKMQSKLEALGIREGIVITKKANMLGKGPIVISVGNGEVALAYEVAVKISVEDL